MNREVKGAEAGREGGENTDRRCWKWDDGGRKGGSESERRKNQEVQVSHMSCSL